MKQTLLTLTASLLTAHAAFAEEAPVTRTWQGIPGLERTTKGRMFVSWFSGGKKEPHPENTVYLCMSDDQGKTFTKPRPMAGPKDGARAFDPALWRDPKGTLWFIFNRGNKDKAEHGVYARTCADPDAPVPAWSEEFRVGYDSAPLSFRLNKLTVLSTGEWVMPVTLATEPIHAWFANEKQLQGVGISSDNGRSWSLHGALKAPPWALENMIVELRDHRLWMLIRTGGGFLWESFSTDRGHSWTEPEASSIANPGSRFFIRRLASGNLLLVNHYQFKGRSHITARLSTDDGQTWNEGLLLDERGGVSYPDGVEDKDGMIWIVYDHDRMGAGEILLANFREEDVAAGKDVSGKVRLKQLVNKLDKPVNPAAGSAKIAVSTLNQKDAAMKVKVFILAGQSNMEGQAVVDLTGKDYNDRRGTLAKLMEDPAKAPMFRHLKDANGKWTVRDDVWVRYQREDRPLLTGPLGFGYSVYGDAHHFGPELQFGHVVGDHFENQVLLIKTAWGGKSLFKDFRPPSSGGETGRYYTLMIAQVREALANLEKAREVNESSPAVVMAPPGRP